MLHTLYVGRFRVDCQRVHLSVFRCVCVCVCVCKGKVHIEL
jgi:hypothetical protein